MARGGGGGGCCPPMDLMRSEAMQLVQVIIPTESAHLAVSYLGDLGLLQFKDLNADKSPFQRTYAAQMKVKFSHGDMVDTVNLGIPAFKIVESRLP